jgi:hypothetical protein
VTSRCDWVPGLDECLALCQRQVQMSYQETASLGKSVPSRYQPLAEVNNRKEL